MKIALVTPYDYPYPGGVTEHVRHLDQEFRALGHETRIIAPSSASQAVLDPHVIRVNGDIVPVRFNGSTARITLSPNVHQEVQEIFAKERFDVVHIHEPELPLLPLVSLMQSQSVTVGTFHAKVETSGAVALAYPLLMLPILERLDGRIFVSKILRETVAPFYFGEMRIIPNGIDFGFFSAPGVQPIAEFDDGRPNLLFVGRMDERKGFRYLLKAYPAIKKKHPAVRLLVVGAYQAEEVAALEPYTRGLRDIHFIGKVSRETLRQYYRTATVFCSPATGAESFGIVLLEAMASGVPIVASDIPGYRSVLTSQHEGLLVHPGNDAQIAWAVNRLLDDPRHRTVMAERGRRTARHYTWKLVAPQILKYYGALVKARAQRLRLPVSMQKLHPYRIGGR